ncbi:hypothetical protein THASP1DRAFT_33833 [Thamnocephalis sphaerospora]|uniref:F-box domain-containing protein n=1 Tax=Thamnocephalis sphaerospora TaxID=78915 RepID=A0A4P9XFM7_9FUNG|nr:hypothetical protein THASP1DRAFT_33833 [Thamnocephalis sphaerospora]|eukprot:RKP04405.1 hypothetical protein THASP1DRAFT_33833 [Thamnocephalis sphaerospora]
MYRLPEEVLDYIFKAAEDGALFLLACTSRQWRARVSHRQYLWRKRFMRQFSQQNKSEKEWLRQYTRACHSKVYSNSAVHETPISRENPQIDWFDAYSKRCATEYRWRHDQYSTHCLDKVTSAPPCGTRLQTLKFKRGLLVASQWLLPSQQQPVWILENPHHDFVCKDELGHKKYFEELRSEQLWYSDDHLLVLAESRSNGSILLAWHLDALHKPPQHIMTAWYNLHVDVYENWVLVKDYAEECAETSTLLVYNLSNNLRFSYEGDKSGRSRIPSAEANRIRFVRGVKSYGSPEEWSSLIKVRQLTIGQVPLEEHEAEMLLENFYIYLIEILRDHEI